VAGAKTARHSSALASRGWAAARSGPLCRPATRARRGRVRITVTGAKTPRHSSASAPACADERLPNPGLHVGQPRACANRAADRLGLAQGGIGKGLIEILSQNRPEIADAFQHGATRQGPAASRTRQPVFSVRAFTLQTSNFLNLQGNCGLGFEVPTCPTRPNRCVAKAAERPSGSTGEDKMSIVFRIATDADNHRGLVAVITARQLAAFRTFLREVR